MTAKRLARRFLLFALALSCAVASSAVASVTAYTSESAFNAAIAGLASVAVLDFEEIAAGTAIPSGTALGGVTFSYAIEGGAELVVIDAFEATSGVNSLGITGDLVFLASDAFATAFPSATAVGLFVIGEDMLPGDVELQTPAGNVANGDPEAVLGDGSSAYFLGVVESDPGLAFTAATLESFVPAEVGDFVWNVDDIRLAPEPTPVSGSIAALLALATFSRATRMGMSTRQLRA